MGQSAAQGPACCSITGIERGTGVVSAKVNATNQAFQFKMNDARALASARIGQAVYANFRTGQVSLDGRSSCCTIITGGPTAPVPPPPPPGGLAAGETRTVALPSAGKPPVLTFGAPRAISVGNRLATLNASVVQRGDHFEIRELRLPNLATPKRALHLQGLDGIENAPEILPEEVRGLLQIHARKTPKGQQTHYIVDPEVVRKWATDHPEARDIKPKSGKKCKGSEWERLRCRTQKSWDNLEEMTDEQWDKLIAQATEWWDEAAKKLKECTTSTDGWKDHSLTGPMSRIQFSSNRSIPLSASKSGEDGGLKGSVRVDVNVGIPIKGDVLVGTEFFYIPCLPGVYRLKSIAAEGNITVGEQLGVTVEALGAFNKTIPVGEYQIPLYVVPIVINGVPVAEFDVSAHLEGNLVVDIKAEARGQFTLTNSHSVNFDVDCNSRRCTANQIKGQGPNVSSTTTTSESAGIRGQVTLTPKLYTALEANFDINVLTARAGPEPFLIGEAAACLGAAGTQTSGGGSSGAQGGSMMADLDWQVDFRAEALVLDNLVGDRYNRNIRAREHLWWKDLAPGGSTALVPLVSGPEQATVGQPVVYAARLVCHPWTRPVKYRITWTGNATPAIVAGSGAPNCTWQAASGDCTFAHDRDLKFSLRWSGTGSQTVSVAITGDDHVSRFSPAPPPRTVAVVVGPTSGGMP
jgi:hypothetical protein